MNNFSRWVVLANLLAFQITLLSTDSIHAAASVQESPTPPPLSDRRNLDWEYHVEGDVQHATILSFASGEAVFDWSKLVFSSYRDLNDFEVYIADGNGSNQIGLTTNSTTDYLGHLIRGCTLITFSSARDGDYEIHTMNNDGSGVLKLTSNSASDSAPVWSPDGTKIAFHSDRNSNQYDIYVMNSNGSNQTRLTTNSAFDGQPSWSPDGSKIAFRSTRSGGWEIWVMNADGSNQVRLNTQAYSENPVWSPDGSKIAYDADGNNDGWQEIYTMNGDGSNQRMVYNPPEFQTDGYVRSWSPDGRYLALTRLSLVYSNGQWYWTTAYMDAWDFTTSSWIRLSNENTDWEPGWQTCDSLPPLTVMDPLPEISSASFTVSWSGLDQGLAGVKSFDVQYKDGDTGAWTDWLIGTTFTNASYSGNGGHTYYFRSRALDSAFNQGVWSPDHECKTTIENIPPRSSLTELPTYSRNGAIIQWNGIDPGGSGIRYFDVQYRELIDGNWVDWQIGTTNTSSPFLGMAGYTYQFRSRAVDFAQNGEAWPSDDEIVQTTIYDWMIDGSISDNGGTPISAANINVSDGLISVFPSDLDGNYHAYMAYREPTYSFSFNKDGYGSLANAIIEAEVNAELNAVLPPEDNLFENWDFELGSFGPENWIPEGTVLPEIIDTNRHTGNYASYFGPVFAFNEEQVNISETDIRSEDPDIVIDDDGNVFIVWIEIDDISQTHYIYFSQIHPDGSQSIPERLPIGYYPRIALGTDGSLHVVWKNSEIIYAQRDIDGSWSPPINISHTSGSSQDPLIKVSENGVVHVLWLERDNEEIFYTQKTLDGSWSTPQNISNTPMIGGYHYDLAVDHTFHAHVVWSDPYPAGDSSIYYSTRLDNGSWTTPIAIYQNVNMNTDAYAPMIEIDQFGTIYVVWWVLASAHGEVYYTQKLIGGDWINPIKISDSPRYSTRPDLTVMPDGTVQVVWMDDSTYRSEILFREKDTLGSWSSIENISQNSGESVHPKFFRYENELYLTWIDETPGNKELFITKRENHAWDTPINLSNNGGSSERPTISFDNRGFPHTVWVDTTPGNMDIFYIGPYRMISDGDLKLSQLVTVPITITHPILSFLYQFNNPLPSSGNEFNVEIINDFSSGIVYSTTLGTSDWIHQWIDLTPWAGHTISVTFNLHLCEDTIASRAFLDEVSLGSGHPDLWIEKTSRGSSVLPGEFITYTITYGNRGGVPAEQIQITDLLPTELTFVSASFPPTSISPALVWEMGELPPGNETYTITLTAQAQDLVPEVLWITNIASISGSSLELEIANNQAQVVTVIGYPEYLPLILRQSFAKSP